MNFPHLRSYVLLGLLTLCLAFSTLVQPVHSQSDDSLWASIFHKPGVGGKVYATLQVDSLLYVGGKFLNMANGSTLTHFAIYDLANSRWIDPGADLSNSPYTEVRAIALDPVDSSIIIGGYFTQVAGNSAIKHVARYDGVSWSSLSGSDDSLDNIVYDIIVNDSAIYLGGWLTSAGGLSASGVVSWRADQGWDNLGGGVRKNYNNDARVYALSMPTSILFVAGWFDSAGTVAASNVASYSGSEWLPLGGGVNNREVFALNVRKPDSDIGLQVTVGGTFSKVGNNQNISFIATYMTSTGQWFPFPNSTLDNAVRTITYDNGYFVGGDFSMRGADTVQYLAFYHSGLGRWISIGNPDNTVYSLEVEQGDLIVGGGFIAIDSQIVSGLTRIDLRKGGWKTYGMGAFSTFSNKDIRSVAVDTAGLVYVGGTFNRLGNAYASALAVWDGDMWSAFDAQPDGSIECVTFLDDTLYIGGQFQNLGSNSIRSIAKWDGQNWIALGPGLTGTVIDIVKGADGKIYAGGAFSSPDPTKIGSFARWDGNSWQFPLNAQSDRFYSVYGVYDLLRFSGGIYLGGSFNFVGGSGGIFDTLYSNNIAYFNISSDSCLPIYRPDSAIYPTVIMTMAIDNGGRLLVGGLDQGMYRDIGNAWVREALPFEPRAMIYTSSGTFIGGLDRYNNREATIIRDIGTSYQSLGSGVSRFDKPNVMGMALDGQRLWVVGNFEMAGGKRASNISYWNIVEPPDTTTIEKQLVVQAHNTLVLFQESFDIYKVFNDRPTFSDLYIDRVFTNGIGRIDLTPLLASGALAIGDTIRLSKVVFTKPSKKHLANQYLIELDNMKFDSLGDVSYDLVLDSSAVQLVTLDHTTVAFNLVVSLEWDATLDFLQKTETCFRKFSNYLYDVSDGQMRLDTVYVFDNKSNWKYADIHIYASNMVWPHVGWPGGIARKAGSRSNPVFMPRVWAGGQSATRNSSYNDYPLDIGDSTSYRTFAHEFGHYGLSLMDEYIFIGLKRKSTRCASTDNYGFMDGQYWSRGVYSSEMSTDGRYVGDGCRNNAHWLLYRQPVWRTVEKAFEGTYSGIPVPIYLPDERTLPSGLDYLPGPFDSTNNLSYDAGSRVVFPISLSAQDANDLKVVFTIGDSIPTLGLPAINVTSYDLATQREIYQGLTSDSGKMWALGVPVAGGILASGYYEDITISSARSYATAPPRKWLYGEATIGGTGVSRRGNTFASYGVGDSLAVALKEVQGDYNLVSKVEPVSGGIQYTLFTSRLFPSEPVLKHIVEGISTSSVIFNSTSSGYTVTITDSLPGEGKIRIEVVDDSGSTFFFPVQYTTGVPDSSGTYEVKGPGGASILSLDSSALSLSLVLISSTAYPTLRNGLDPQSQQAGNIHTVGFQPNGGPTGDYFLTLRYEDSELKIGSGLFGEEANLRVFRWNETLFAWEFIGGGVDTIYNEVFAQINGPGTYALFTTDIITDIDEADGIDGEAMLPKRFKIHQNYPNPFNPTTVISYSLPIKAEVTISIYNILGQKIKYFDQGLQSAGEYSVIWDATDEHGRTVGSGIYFYKVTAGDFSASRKMVLLK